MAGDFIENDLRVRKTYRALHDALITLLNRRNFNSVTVHDLCREALISRATFYAHFRDKYDLLEYLLSQVRRNVVKDVCKYDELEKEVNQFVDANKKVITNILKDADDETLALVRSFMVSVVELAIKQQDGDEAHERHLILFNFCSGGLVNLLTWIVENNFPPQITVMNRYLYKMLKAMVAWDAEPEQEKGMP